MLPHRDGGSPIGAAQVPIDGPSLYLRWEADPARDGVQAGGGEVLNDGRPAAQRVRLLVEQLDASGRVINRGEMGVLGEVPADGRSYFCVPGPAGGATYRLTVTGADSMSTTGREPPGRGRNASRARKGGRRRAGPPS